MPAELSSLPDVAVLYQRYGRAVHQRCHYFLRHDEDARDAMHEVFLKVVERYGEFRGEASPLTWIVRIATNHCLNLLRSRRAPWRERFGHTATLEATINQARSAGGDKQTLVRELLGHIPHDLHEPAVYYFVDEMTQDEAAAACRCSIPTLRKRLRRFVELARKRLRHDDPETVFGEVPL